MVQIKYDFDIDGALRDDPFLDRLHIHMMFEQTRQSIEHSLRRKLDDVVCSEHAAPPEITISGRFDADREEFDISYHVDTCCQLFLVRVIKVLNNVG